MSSLTVLVTLRAILVPGNRHLEISHTDITGLSAFLCILVPRWKSKRGIACIRVSVPVVVSTRIIVTLLSNGHDSHRAFIVEFSPQLLAIRVFQQLLAVRLTHSFLSSC